MTDIQQRLQNISGRLSRIQQTIEEGDFTQEELDMMKEKFATPIQKNIERLEALYKDQHDD